MEGQSPVPGGLIGGAGVEPVSTSFRSQVSTVDPRTTENPLRQSAEVCVVLLLHFCAGAIVGFIVGKLL